MEDETCILLEDETVPETRESSWGERSVELDNHFHLYGR